MKTYLFILLLVLPGSMLAQTADEKAVASAVEQLRQAMVRPDEKTFQLLVMDQLSYGHSSGLIEEKKTFIESLVNGKYKFETIELTEQRIEVVEKTALVRHTLFAHTHDKGKDPTTVKLSVLTVWHKQNNKWRLLARQAVRI
jgi:ketosteroid isomerase-like protein